MSNRPAGDRATMATRSEPKKGLDFFPTPPWATRALLAAIDGNWMAKHASFPREMNHSAPDLFENVYCWEPACGAGDMAEPLREKFKRVLATDAGDYSEHYERQDYVHDFLMPYLPAHVLDHNRLAIVTNPPFHLFQQFLHQALSQYQAEFAAFFGRVQILEGGERFKQIFRFNPPDFVFQFVERVNLRKGRLDKHVSTASSFVWLVWWRPLRVVQDGLTVTRFLWIPPCRKHLEKSGDYKKYDQGRFTDDPIGAKGDPGKRRPRVEENENQLFGSRLRDGGE